MRDLEKLIKAYYIRGTVPDPLDTDLAWQIGAAFARWAGSPSIVLVRDMRPSSRTRTRARIGLRDRLRRHHLPGRAGDH